MKIICIGDSFTRGFGVNRGWLSRLSDSISSEGIELINKGINGDTTSGMLARFKDDVASEAPKYVIITGGLNDFISGSSLEIPKNNYMAMVHHAFHYNIIPIVGIEPDFEPSMIRQDWASFCDFNEASKKHSELCSWLKSLCSTFNLFYIDFCSEFKQVQLKTPGTSYFIDGLHLTADGHECISKIAEGFIRSNIIT